MTYTIELNESEERVLEDAARRRDVALDVYLRDAVREKAMHDAPEFLRDAGAGFLAMLDHAQPIIAAGTLRPLTSETINSAVDTVRDRINQLTQTGTNQ